MGKVRTGKVKTPRTSAFGTLLGIKGIKKAVIKKVNPFVVATPIRQATGGWLTGRTISIGGTVALFGTEEKYGIVVSLMRELRCNSDAKIFVPGVGLSDVGPFLYHLGYNNLVLSDIKEAAESSEFQGTLETAKLFRSLDILTTEERVEADLIIDSSVLDVFLQSANMGIGNALQGLKRQLKQNGILVSFSMNNVTIRRPLMREFKFVYHTFIRLLTPTTVSRPAQHQTKRSDITLWVCSDKELDVRELGRVNRDYFGFEWKCNPRREDINNPYGIAEKFTLTNSADAEV